MIAIALTTIVTTSNVIGNHLHSPCLHASGVAPKSRTPHVWSFPRCCPHSGVANQLRAAHVKAPSHVVSPTRSRVRRGEDRSRKETMMGIKDKVTGKVKQAAGDLA